MTTTNFDSGSLIFNDGVTSATYSGWTFGASSAVDFANAHDVDISVLLNQSGGRSIILNYGGANVTNFYFKSSDGSDFQLNSFKIDNGPNGASNSLTISGYRDNALIVSAEAVNLITSDATGNIIYTQQSNAGPEYSGLLTFNSAFNNIDEIRFAFNSAVELTIDDIDISAAVVPPTITSATYNASTNSLVVTGTNMVATSGATNDIDVSKLTLTGQGGATYTLTSSNVEITSATQFTVALNAEDQINVEGLLNKNGTSAVDATTFNLAAAADWNPAQTGNSDTTGNPVTVSNVQIPTITSATYNASTGSLVVTGVNFVKASGATNDITANKFTLYGEGAESYTLTDTANVEITSGTAFTLTLSATDKAGVNQIINQNGGVSTDISTYYLEAADDWNTVIGDTDISDDSGNNITASNVAVPAITSATYDASSGVLVVTGSNFLSRHGAANDIIANKFTLTGEGGATYTLTDTANVDITSGTAFTLTLSATDKAGANMIINKNGTLSTDISTYNLAAAEDWAAGAAMAVDVADLTGNGITASSVAAPAITSATYDASSGVLVVTGSGFLSRNGAANDIIANKFTLTGEGGATYTLTDTANVDITSGTAFTLTLSATDKAGANMIINQNGTLSTDISTYNLTAAEDWAAGAAMAVDVADLTGNGITASSVAAPAITFATYDASSGVLVVTGSGFLSRNGAVNDIIANKFTLTGEGGATYTLTDTANVDITSGTAFTLTLSATDKAGANMIINKNGTLSTDISTYNLAAAEDWAAGAAMAVDVADLTGNGITASNVAVPAITSATYDASSGVLVVTGSGFLSRNGTVNDIIANKFTLTGEGGATYTLTDTANVDITSGTAFTLTLSATDKAGANMIINKNGTLSTDISTYNLAAAEDWAAGAAMAVDVADLTGNGITASNVAIPAITSATYDASSGVLVITGTNFLSSHGAANDIIANKFTLTGEGGATYTLTDTANVDITSGTAFTLTLSATDKAGANMIINKSGTASNDAKTYNLAAAEDWAAGADASVDVADLTGNGINATIPITSSGNSGSGGNASPNSKTIDGAAATVTTQSNGTVVTTVLPVVSNRQDDPNSLFGHYADIPVTTDANGNASLIISLPVGVGLNSAGKPQLQSLQNATNDLMQRIEQKTGSNSTLSQEIINRAQEFLSTLNTDERVTVHTITPSISDNRAPDIPIIITGSSIDNNSKQILIVDVRNLPSGTIIQLDNVAFASIIGATRVVGGSGENFAVGDDQNQFIVLGAENDILFGGGGDDTIGSLGGDDQTSGDSGNDIVFGGSGNDRLSGGSGNDQLNGGLGFDIALQEGQLSDYRIEVSNDKVTLIQNSNGETDSLTDIELIQFATGNTVAIAYSENEAVAHHLAKTWLHRDLTAAEGNAIQNWQNATTDDILAAFYSLPEAAGLQDRTSAELLDGLETNPDIIRINATREFTGGVEDNQGYLPLGLALQADGGAGYDVLRMPGTRDDVHLEFVDDRLELTQLSDGAMLSLKNAEMIAFDSGETVVIAHNATEGTLSRLFHSFMHRNASVDEWQLGREALQAQVNPDMILDWFQQHADLDALSNAEYVQTIYSQTLERSATADELSIKVSRLVNNQVDRQWLAVEIAQSTEAAAQLIGSVMLQEGWF
ncbi:beta strand repeat-containing protein [Nitrosomonas supralitoralis]|uniref:DUF4214 domain-containing protein n=1 Tax=Nitrosomonas supralitoralis TaxID=2116706 RepID=A0A2P7NZH7_9PROT|nr:DUF4214 domain-containing protein [Nitrosomonas supralitoralis]PSJ18892.1 DUF4214 domain-containing protein [Nitrosomonas supralitoralis]